MSATYLGTCNPHDLLRLQDFSYFGHDRSFEGRITEHILQQRPACEMGLSWVWQSQLRFLYDLQFRSVAWGWHSWWSRNLPFRGQSVISLRQIWGRVLSSQGGLSCEAW
mmetsp:Transcript_33429/g.77045  ORF Transcript_33429/g.77045 Transcript_33429/m.77045 type:complete len:109 (+) Transcript_33429:248-574(+)